MSNHRAQSVWRPLLAAVVLGAAGLAALACGGAPAGPARAAAATEPVAHAFVGALDGRPPVQVALLVGHTSSEAYLCDNHSGSELLQGPVRLSGPGGSVDLKAADGTVLQAAFDARNVTGTITLPGQAAAHFTAQLATGAAGLYQAAGGNLLGRWIVGDDGAVAGVVRRAGLPVANPALQSTVRVGTTTLAPTPVHAIGINTHILPLFGPPQITNAFSLPCGTFFVTGSGFDPGAPIQVVVVHEYDYGFIAVENLSAAKDGTFVADLKFSASPTWRSDNGKNVLAIADEYPGNPNVYVQPSMYAYAC